MEINQLMRGHHTFGAISTIAICAGGVMGLPLLISDYRHKKILKRLQVTPVSQSLILAVHLVIYGLYAVISLIFVWGIATLFFNYQIKGAVLHFLSGYLLVMFSMFSVGMMVGGIAPDMKTASIIASILYFPMLIFSGATLPYEVMPQGLQKIVDILPLTQGIKLLKAASLGLPKEGVMFPIMMMCLLALLCIGISIKFFKWE